MTGRYTHGSIRRASKEMSTFCPMGQNDEKLLTFKV
jgi:hypothetical protein